MDPYLVAHKGLKIGNDRFLYSDAFVHVDAIASKNLTKKDKRIFWGEGLLLKKHHPAVEGNPEVTDYVFLFDPIVPEKDGEKHEASLKVWKNQITAYPGKRRLNQWLDDILGAWKGKRVRVYAYGHFDLAGPDDRGRRFLNFKIQKLDHLYFFSI
jgi:hypothetical protein